MDSYGFAIVSCVVISTTLIKKQFECKCYNVVGPISKTMKLLEI
jgi:hypothetical protein